MIVLGTKKNIYALAKEKFKLLRNFKINHVYKEGNQVAHCLAQFATRCSTNQVWLECPPPFLQRFLEWDVPTSYF
jgi:hypothetical protein